MIPTIKIRTNKTINVVSAVRHDDLASPSSKPFDVMDFKTSASQSMPRLTFVADGIYNSSTDTLVVQNSGRITLWPGNKISRNMYYLTLTPSVMNEIYKGWNMELPNGTYAFSFIAGCGINTDLADYGYYVSMQATITNGTITAIDSGREIPLSVRNSKEYYILALFVRWTKMQ